MADQIVGTVDEQMLEENPELKEAGVEVGSDITESDPPTLEEEAILDEIEAED